MRSQEVLAELAGMSRRWLAEIESGKDPKLSTAVKLATELAIRLPDIDVAGQLAGATGGLASRAEMMEDVKRRQFLGRLTGLAGVLLSGEGLIQDPEQPTIDELQEITQRYGSSYWRVSPASLLPSLFAHQHRLFSAIEAASAASRNDHLALAARTTVLAGLVAYRLGDASTAQERFLAAERLAQLAGDRTSEAMAMTARRAVLGGLATFGVPRQHAAAHQLLSAAETVAGPRAPALLLTWLYASRAEEAAALRLDADALHDLDKAGDALARAGTHDRIGFFDHWDEFRLEGWHASVLLAIDQPMAAGQVLAGVVAHTPTDLPGPRAAVLADMAAAEAEARHVEHSCALLHQALDVARKAGAQDGVARVRRVRQRYLAGWASSPCVRHLDQALLAA